MSWYLGKFKKYFSALKSTKGFSLLELTVVITIFLIITVVVVADIPNFREKGSLDLTVSEVATYIRGAQVYGAAQKGEEPYYLIHFEAGSPTFCLLSRNKDNCPSNFEEKYEINGFTIGSFFINDTKINAGAVDIVFSANDYSVTIGTKLEPKFYYDYSQGSTISQINYLGVEIVSLRNSANSYCVRIYNNGQITPAPCNL